MPGLVGKNSLSGKVMLIQIR